MNPSLQRILTLLRSHVGRDNLISAEAIATAIGLPQRDGARIVRDLLSEALHDGTLEDQEIPLCAIPGKGYFLASDIEEAQAYADWCRSLAAEAARKSVAVTTLFKSLGLHLQPAARAKKL